jgi:small subunit ribosomal protein S15
MTLTKKRKEEVIEKYGLAKTDTGSSNVQVALLTERINEITDHLKKHKKDHNSRRALLKLVGQRRKILNYMKRTKLDDYTKMVESLNLRK